MARIKYEITLDSTLVKFGALQTCEVFIDGDVPYMVVLKKGNAVCLKDGVIVPFEDNELVTYVRKAELKLTI